LIGVSRQQDVEWIENIHNQIPLLVIVPQGKNTPAA
jgi:hypothetical protein